MSQSTDTLTVTAPAKINLCLHVTGQRADGYHLLDSLVAFSDFGDTLVVEPSPEMGLTVNGPMAAGVPADARNLVWKAALVLNQTLDITLTKNLPSEAGIGGGSSDAAALLRVPRERGSPIPCDLALSLGADVPVCVNANAARMSGVGEHITPLKLPPLPALIVNPLVSVPTGSVFSALRQKSNPGLPLEIPQFGDATDCAYWLSKQRNDLELPATQAAPVINRVLSDLNDTKNILLSRMSGSGATCFALYPTLKDAQFAAYEFGAAHTDWWIRTTTLT